MKTLIQIVVAIVIIVAAARGGEAAWRFYQLEDAVEQELRYGTAKTTSELHQRVFELAQQHDVPLEYDAIVVEARDGETTVTGSYVEPITIVPAVYTRQQQFDIEVSARAVRPLKVDEPQR